MRRFNQAEIELVSRPSAGDEIAFALAVYHTQYPPDGNRIYQDPDREMIEGPLRTQPATLAFLHPDELRDCKWAPQ